MHIIIIVQRVTHLGDNIIKQLAHELGVRLRKSLHHELAVFVGKMSSRVSGVDGAMKRCFDGSFVVGDGGVLGSLSVEGLDCVVEVFVGVCSGVESVHDVSDGLGGWKGVGAADEGGGQDGVEEILDSNHLGCCCGTDLLCENRGM